MNAELLLDTPKGMAAQTRAQLLPALIDLRSSLMSQDSTVYSDLFGVGGERRSALPQRRGYLLGLVVARRLGRSHSLEALADMPAEKVRPLVLDAIDEIIAEARRG